MKLDELTRRLAGGETAVALAEAAGQRMVRAPEQWDWEAEGGVCECGLLMVRLPRTLRVTRHVVTFGRVFPVTYDMTHAHAADAAGRPMCSECADSEGGGRCPEHPAEMCDTPTVVLCGDCQDAAALPGDGLCRGCLPYEVEWDKDMYLGL